MAFNPRISQKEGTFISNSGTKLTMHMSYPSEADGRTGMIKMEVNLQDLIIFPPRKAVALRSLISPLDIPGSSRLFGDEFARYHEPVTLDCYSPEEIFAEKGRAMLTRVDYKVRDAFDMAMLAHEYRFDLSDFEEAIKEKTKFTVARFDRYMRYLRDKAIPELSALAGEDIKLVLNMPSWDLLDAAGAINRHMDLRVELLRELGTEN